MVRHLARTLGLITISALLPLVVVPRCVLRVVLDRIQAARLERVKAARAAKARRQAERRRQQVRAARAGRPPLASDEAKARGPGGQTSRGSRVVPVSGKPAVRVRVTYE
jgi:hypothetical protein